MVFVKEFYVAVTILTTYLTTQHLRRFLGVLLLDSAIAGVLMSEDKVELVVIPALVWSKHDSVRRLVVELTQVWFRVSAAGQKFQVGTATVLAFLEYQETNQPQVSFKFILFIYIHLEKIN